MNSTQNRPALPDPSTGSDDATASEYVQPRWLRVLGLASVALLLSLFFWSPMLGSYPNTQGGDGPQVQKIFEAARVSIFRYHEWPLWNPYECGGLPLWDHPTSLVAAPLSWSMLLVDTTLAMDMWLVAHSALGFLCMWVFARHELRLSREATFVASCVWAFCGFHQQHYSGGHLSFVPFLYFPLALFLWRRAEIDTRHAVGLGLLVAWMIVEGGVYPLPHLAIFLAAEALMRAWPPVRTRRIVRAGLVVLLVGLSVGAVRFFPVIEQLRTHTRQLGPETDALQWETLKEMFLARTHARSAPGQQYVWPEFGAYIGPILLSLAILGMAIGGLEFVWLLALLVLAFALMLGHVGPYAPWSLLKEHVYPFQEMRVPSRFRAEVSLFFAAFIGIAIDRIPRRANRWLARARLARRPAVRGVRLTLVAVAFIGVGDMMGVGMSWFASCFDNPPRARLARSSRLYLGGPDLASFIDQPAQNRGRLQCWDEWGFGAGAPLWEGDVPQARSSSPDAIVESVRRTQNTFTFDVDAKLPSRIAINSTYDAGWRADVGTVVENAGRLDVEVPAGRHQVHLKYVPQFFSLGLTLTGLSSVLVVVFFAKEGRERRVPGGIRGRSWGGLWRSRGR